MCVTVLYSVRPWGGEPRAHAVTRTSHERAVPLPAARATADTHTLSITLCSRVAVTVAHAQSDSGTFGGEYCKSMFT